MGTKERQDRERQAVTASILDAARDLFIAEGYQSVSIRKIAERIEYSPAAIVIIRNAARGAIANGRKACAAFTLTQAATPTAPLRYRPVHRAQTGN